MTADGPAPARSRAQLKDDAFRRLEERITLPRALATIAIVVMSLVFLAAWLERRVEPETFPTYGRALWWAVVTVCTVGYGDVVPQSPAGRAVASVLMIAALSIVPLITSVVVSLLLSRRQREQLAAFRASEQRAGELLAEIRERLQRLEERGEGPGAGAGR